MRCLTVMKGKHDTKHGMANVDYTCRKCLPCRITARQEWTARSLLEMRTNLYTYYVTLTYNDLHLPPRASLSRKALSDFLKRLRKNTGFKLRYIACGEYGDRRGRPHYHALIFSNNEFTVKTGYCTERRKVCSIGGDFHQAWNINGSSFGLVDVVPLYGRDDCRRVAAYITGYVLKKMTDEKQLPGKEPEFQTMSKKPGIGSKWIETFAGNLKRQGVGPTHYDGVSIEHDFQMIRIDGKLWPMGRFLRDKLLEQWPDGPSALTKALRQHQRAFMRFILQETEEFKAAEQETRQAAAKMFKKYKENRLRQPADQNG